MIYACPKCGVQYEIDQPGEYQCSQCNQEFIIDPEPTRPVQKLQPIQLVQPIQTTDPASLSEIAYNQEIGQESGVQALRRKFAEESMQNGPAGFAKYNGKWVPMHRDKLSLLAYVLLGLIGITSAFGVHLFYAKCNNAGAGMIFLSILGIPFAWVLGTVIHPIVTVIFCLSYFLYWLITLLYGWEEIKKYNGD